LHVVFADPEQPLFQEIRKAWPGALIANPVLGWGGPLPADGGRAAGERLLAAGADLISLGRSFLANPDLVGRMRAAAPRGAVHCSPVSCRRSPKGCRARPGNSSALPGRRSGREFHKMLTHLYRNCPRPMDDSGSLPAFTWRPAGARKADPVPRSLGGHTT
ncbi:hypothetical protein ACWGI5_16055, partial [Streptomyces xanthophaeus]